MKKKEYLIYKLSDEMKSCTRMDANLFKKLDVKRGLRNEDGTGVLVGLTNIGNVVGYDRHEDGTLEPIDGKLFFRGYEVKDLCHAFLKEDRMGFEETAFLLLSGRLPDQEELEQFRSLIFDNMPLEQKTVLHIIEMEGTDIMNILARSVMEFYTYDSNPDQTTRENLMRQSIELISKFPTIIAYAYNMLRHKEYGRTLHLRYPKERYSIAENFLFMLKGEGFTKLDAQMLDLLMILHSEHGGGNNSTFTVRVTSSAGTDTYSSIAAGIGSLKGPKHGGANLKVCAMMDCIKKNVKDWTNEDEIAAYINKILNKEAFDNSGLVYGIGHAVYTKSDPRTVVLKEMAAKLAEEKCRTEEYEFMQLVEKVAIREVSAFKSSKKPLCANIDFYSGFIYDCIGIPKEVYTPLFAMARIVGWCAHRNEELNFDARRIIRPAYRCVTDERTYKKMSER